MTEAIKVNNLVKSYKGTHKRSVDNISFKVNAGEFFAFLGPNGAGKTTTISILTTTLAKTSGEVKVAGFDIEKEARKVREKIGIIFQNPSLDPQLTVEQNLRFHACLYGMYSYRPAFKLMDKSYREQVMSLGEIMNIEQVLFSPVKRLSGGTQRKVEIVRSLIHTPEILFLDEPTQGLDATSRRELWDYIENIRNKYGTTIFLTTHYIEEAENVDQLCLIHQGKIATCSSPEELKSSLLKQELIIDAHNRSALLEELSLLKIPFVEKKHIIIPYKNTAQEIISQLQTKLSVLKIHEPSLEDAYVEFLNQKRSLNND